MLYLSITLQLRLTHCYEGETRQGNRSTDQRSPREIGYASEKLKYSLIIIIISARILRLLATNHIFIEVSPEVFANNRLSSVLDTGKSVEELLARLALSLMVSNHELTITSPESKHTGTPGMASIFGHM